MDVVTRNAAWSSVVPADGWSEDLRWYAAAVHQMRLLTPGLDRYRPLAFRVEALLALETPTAAQARETDRLLGELAAIIGQWGDPRSLGYQAQVHATFMWPQSSWPRFQGTRALWHECAHGNWFFLPWHRAYLLEFEAVARAHIERLGGPHETWALPYWNSSDYRSLPQAATLPLPLRDAALADGIEVEGVTDGANPLHEPSRIGPRPLTRPPSFRDWPDASAALQREHYANAEDSDLVSFAGGYLEDLRFFHSAQEAGQIDLQPHGLGHTETGGFMSSFFTAGLDPVFWMHHANIDRLWETYARDLGHGYPFPDGRPAGGLAADAFDSWSQREFSFLRADGSVKGWNAPSVLETERLGYRYDTTAPPVFNPVPAPPPGADVDPFGFDRLRFTPVAAASGVRVAGAATVVLAGGDGDAGEGAAAAADPDLRWNVRFDGIRCRRPALTSYAVYLGLDDDATEDEARLIGSLSLFGVFESSIRLNGDPGSVRRFDATAIVRALAGFDPFAARLTLVPLDREADGAGLTVERISLEVG